MLNFYRLQYLSIPVIKLVKIKFKEIFLVFFQNLSSKPTLAGYSKRRINFGQPNV